MTKLNRRNLPASLFKILHLLDSISKKKIVKGFKVGDIAQKVGYSLSTTYIYLAKLDRLGFITREQNRTGKNKDECKIIIKING